MRRISGFRVRQLEQIHDRRYKFEVGMHCLRRVCRRVNEGGDEQRNRDAALGILCGALHGIGREDVQLHNHAWQIARAVEELEGMGHGELIAVAVRVDRFDTALPLVDLVDSLSLAQENAPKDSQ